MIGLISHPGTVARDLWMASDRLVLSQMELRCAGGCWAECSVCGCMPAVMGSYDSVMIRVVLYCICIWLCSFNQASIGSAERAGQVRRPTRAIMQSLDGGTYTSFHSNGTSTCIVMRSERASPRGKPRRVQSGQHRPRPKKFVKCGGQPGQSLKMWMVAYIQIIVSNSAELHGREFRGSLPSKVINPQRDGGDLGDLSHEITRPHANKCGVKSRLSFTVHTHIKPSWVIFAA